MQPLAALHPTVMLIALGDRSGKISTPGCGPLVSVKYRNQHVALYSTTVLIGEYLLDLGILSPVSEWD